MARKTFTLTLDLEGAALSDESTAEVELSDILRGVAARLDLLRGEGGWKHNHGFTVADSNGNRVGQAEIRTAP